MDLELEFIGWDTRSLGYASFEIVDWKIPIHLYNVVLVNTLHDDLVYFIRKILNLLLAKSVLSFLTSLYDFLLRFLVLSY